jgi:hypothetical protein
MLLKIDPKIFFTFRQFHCKFSTVTSINQFSQLPPTIGHNVLALGEEADFEAQNCLPALNLIRSTTLHLSTQPAFLPSAC